MRTRILSITTTVLMLVVVSCTDRDGGDGGDGVAVEPSSPTTSAIVTPVGSSTVAASPTPPALPDERPPRRGVVASDCVNGWVTPPKDSPRFLEPLGIIRRTTGVVGPLEVVDMRYFEGPESPPSDAGYLLVVQRWYVKLFARGDLSFQGRFLVEARRFGRGVSAVAPYDTFGFRSDDWVGFQYETVNTEPRAYDGLPGSWSGAPYDFVEGGQGLAIPGLPDEVAGCLDAT